MSGPHERVDLAAVVARLLPVIERDPLAREPLAALDALFGQVADPTQLAPRTPEMTAPQAAVHALALQRAGHTATALELLIDVAQVDADRPYLAWTRAWSWQPEQLDRDALARCENKLLELLRRPRTASRALLRAAAELLLRIGSGESRLVVSAAARRAGEPALAREAALSAFAERADWLSAVHVGLAAREAGELESAAEWLARAAELEPGEASIRLDLADVLLDAGEFARARQLYATLGDDTSGWREASLLACAWLGDGDREARARLRAHAEAGQTRAEELLDAPFDGWLPEPADPSSRTLRHTIAALRGTTNPAWRVHWEAERPLEPSLQLALSVAAARAGVDLELRLTIGAAPLAPLDVAQAVSPWVLRGHAAGAALEPPDPALSTALAGIAAGEFSLAAWARAAHALGAALGPPRAVELVASLAHVPLPEADCDALDWVQRVQLAAALALTAIDDGWAGSMRRTLLLGIAGGPPDFTTGAALLALSHLAQHEPDARAEVLEHLKRAHAALPVDGWPRFMLAAAGVELEPAPDLRRTLWRELRAWLAAYRRQPSGV